MDYNTLLAMLYALKYGASDIHYLVHGENFWGDHKFADELRADIDSWIDDINEVCFLGEEQDAPYSKDVVTLACDFIPVHIPDEVQSFRNLKDLVRKILEHIEELTGSASVGEANLIGGIAEELQKRFGLLSKRVK